MKSVNIFLDMDAELVKGSETIESEIDRAVPELATGSSKRYAEEELDQESSKRQKTSESSKLAEEPRDKEADELSQEELQQTMIIVPEQGMNVEALQTKYLIISLVKEKFNSTEPTDDKEKEIWVELKRLFEPNTDDELWKLQKHIHDLTWSSWWIKIMRCPENFLGRYSCRLKDQEDKVFGYILLVKIKLIIKKLKDSKVMIVTIAGSSYNYWLELLLLLKIEEKVLIWINILKCFKLGSGLKVNLSKSRIIGVGVPINVFEEITASLGCALDSIPFIYLGLPVGRKMRLCEGMYWVKWNSIFLDFKSRGLGVGSLHAKNLSLLGKWKWRFLIEDKALWHVVITEFYGSEDGFNSPLNSFKTSGIWVDIIKSIKNIKAIDASFDISFMRKVKDEGSTLFWKDPWYVVGSRLMDIFLRLYALDWCKDCLGRAINEVSGLALLIDNLILSVEGSDKWLWSYDDSASLNRLPMRANLASRVSLWHPLTILFVAPRLSRFTYHERVMNPLDIPRKTIKDKGKRVDPPSSFLSSSSSDENEEPSFLDFYKKLSDNKNLTDEQKEKRGMFKCLNRYFDTITK
ncbi:hypothetical protein Tco_0957671 [Tanacetum coccineum]